MSRFAGAGDRLVNHLRRTLTIENMRGDAKGAVSTALLSIPGNIAYGVLSFAPLGDQYLYIGVLAGVLGGIVTTIVASLIGGTPALIVSPKPAIAIVIYTVVTQIPESRIFNAVELSDPMFFVTLSFFILIFSGIIQTLLGFLRVGIFLKYIPHPVVAGFINSTALLIVISQVGPILGLPKLKSLADLYLVWRDIQPATLAVALVTGVMTLFGPKIIKFIPGVIQGLMGGTGVYYLIDYLNKTNPESWNMKLGSTVGLIALHFPPHTYVQDFAYLVAQENITTILAWLIAPALGIAILASIDSLLSSLAIADMTGVTSNTNRTLAGQGIANIVSATFGGTSGAGNMLRTVTNYKDGARTSFSGILAGIFMLLMVTVFGKVLAAIPHAALAGILVVTSINMLDKWSIDLVKKYITGTAMDRSETAKNILTIAMVVAVALLMDLVAAVAAGIITSIFIFIMKMTKSVIRRSFDCATVSSMKRRSKHFSELLRKHGNKIHVFELEGIIFFGTADSLQHDISRLIAEKVRVVILDLKRVTDIDSTGAKVIQRIHKEIKAAGDNLYLSHLTPGSQMWNFLADTGMIRTIGENNIFPDMDSAIQHAEDSLIDEIMNSDFDAYIATRSRVYNIAQAVKLAAASQETQDQKHEPHESICKQIENEIRTGVGYFIFNASDMEFSAEQGSLSAGLVIIRNCREFVTASEKHFALCGIAEGSKQWDILKNEGLIDQIGDHKVYFSESDALLWVKAEVRSEFSQTNPESSTSVTVDRMDLLHGLTLSELEELMYRLELASFKTGEAILTQGGKSDEILMLLDGIASAYITIPGQENMKRVATFSPGTFIGEMMILDETKPRMAYVIADTDIKVFRLRLEQYHELVEKQPAITMKIQKNVALEFVERFRKTNLQLAQLEG